MKEFWSNHPNPMMKRDKWVSLNGIWKLNGSSITVPYPPQSELSGYDRETEDILIYERKFVIPEDFDKDIILLHFGAVDQIAEVWINDIFIGKNEGGYLSFEFDITEAVNRKSINSIRVKATDTLSSLYPYGKQSKNRGGMWYTPVSGIWQSIWLENVPESYIKEIKITPDLNGIDIETDCLNCDIEIALENGEVLKQSISDGKGRVDLRGYILSGGREYEPILWTPENPHLYTFSVISDDDSIESYFALRTVSIRNFDGVNRVCLNGEPVFFHGVLDQGYFSDGIFTPKSEIEYEKDILRMKELGFNMLRKHIKIEPPCFYEACDRLGMFVMQDMVNNGEYNFFKDTALPTIGLKKKDDTKGDIGELRKKIFIEHMKGTVKQLYNYPCIVAYTIFNEGWGQFNSDELYCMLKKMDSTRLVDSTSGWFSQKENDFDSEHIYFKTKELKPGKRPMFLTECGGYTLKVEGHCFNDKKQYGYGKSRDKAHLTSKIIDMYEKMVLPAVKKGLCGCIYTQLSDVEDEINGLYTYDRMICKVEIDKMAELADELKNSVFKKGE